MPLLHFFFGLVLVLALVLPGTPPLTADPLSLFRCAGTFFVAQSSRVELSRVEKSREAEEALPLKVPRFS
jgi:hypothetical protein